MFHSYFTINALTVTFSNSLKMFKKTENTCRVIVSLFECKRCMVMYCTLLKHHNH